MNAVQRKLFYNPFAKVTALDVSVAGIESEIEKRENTLRRMKAWYINPKDCSYSFSMRYFYFVGVNLMKEVRKLEKIKEDLQRLSGL